MTVSVNGIRTSGPNGMTANVTKAGITAMMGARKKTTLSAALGTMSSFSASLTPSASDCSRPVPVPLSAAGLPRSARTTSPKPCTLGPMRCCIRATTRRSAQMLNSVSSTSTRKISTALRMMTQTES